MLNSVWRQRQYIALATLLLVVVASPIVLAEEKIEWEESIEKGLAEAKKTGKPVMMDFYTEWWGWCKRLDADTFTDPKIVALSKKFVNLKVNPEDTDRPENEEARIKYGVSGYPVVVFLSAEGDLIRLNSGYSPPEEFFGVMESVSKEEEAFNKLKVAIQKNPDDSKANAGLALIYINRGKLEQGKPLFDKVVKKDPNNETGLLPELYVNLALHYGLNAVGDNEKDYFQKAEELFQKVIDTYPDSKFYEDAQYYLGVTYAVQEKFEPAIAILEKLRDAKNEEIRREVATWLERLKSSMR